MTERRKSEQQMIGLNQQVMDQTNQIKNIHRIAEEADETSRNIMTNLYDQRGKIERNIDMVVDQGNSDEGD